MSPSIISEVGKDRSRPFRRMFLKRRLATTGLFETDWQDISVDVKKWGHIRRSIDAIRNNKFTFGDIITEVANDQGRYNPEDDPASIWYGYANQQRTLVKIEAGFVHQTLASNGIWTNTEYPASPIVFIGIASGDMLVSDQNSVTLPIKPLSQIFRDFPARNLVGFTSTGLTASQFITMLRDQTDGAGSFIFRPFFGDTTSYWNYTTTSNVYLTLNTSTSEQVRDKDCWDIIEKLAESEDMVAFTGMDGTFNFKSRAANTATAQFKMFGSGVDSTEYGRTIKRIYSYGKKISSFYSRVEVKWIDSSTVTALRVRELPFLVGGSNSAWNLGVRTYRFENLWIQTITVADSILDTIFNNVSVLKEQLDFSTSFIPHLDVLDRIEVSYDSSEKNIKSRWDVQDWAESSTYTSDLYWDYSTGDAIRFDNKAFKILGIDLDLDKLETKFLASAI